MRFKLNILCLFLYFAHPLTALVVREEKEWLKLLGVERYRIMRQKGTEKAFTGTYLKEQKPGIYVCFACEHPLFHSEDRYEEPGSGWLAFSQPIEKKSVFYQEDWDLPFKRYQVLCRNCESHLGHVFHDGPPPKHLRFTINSIALKKIPLY